MIKKQVMDLWRICFEDSEEFIRFYFDRKYNEKNTMVVYQDGTVLSALQMLPYPMTWNNTLVSTAYISGACTLPEARSQGFMRKLLTKAFRTMKSRKIAFSTLLPANEGLYDYYALSGYAPVFAYNPENYYLSVCYPHPSVHSLKKEEINRQFQELYHYFEHQMLQRPCCIQHTQEDFRAIIDDLYMSEGRLFVYFTPNANFAGMAFALPCPDKIHLTELLYDSEEEKSALLHTISCEWGKREIDNRKPVESSRTIQRGMARIIDACQVLNLYAASHPYKSFRLKLTDPDIPANNGYYRIRNGKNFVTGMGIHKVDFELSIQELTTMLFEQPAFMSLMLD